MKFFKMPTYKEQDQKGAFTRPRLQLFHHISSVIHCFDDQQTVAHLLCIPLQNKPMYNFWLQYA